MPLTQTGRLLTVSTPLGADAFLLTGFRGREELSRPFSFQLDLVSDQIVSPAAVVGQPVEWTVNRPDESPRVFHGRVRSMAVGAAVGRGLRAYRAEVVPWLWFLTRTTDCRVHQNLSVPDIVTATFDRFGFADYTLNLSGSYPPREYCVQYRETAFDFVSRLLEEEGIFYTFAFESGKHTLVLADATSAYADCDPHASVEFRPDTPTAEVVSVWDRQYQFVSGKAAVTDYNFETPATNLLGTTDSLVSLSGNSPLERFEYPGGYAATADGKAVAKRHIEEEEAGYDTADGAGGCSSFTAGGKFTLTAHPLDDGQSFALTAVEHTATEPGIPGVRDGRGEYGNGFRCIPADRPFRPARLTPRPVAVGPQSAVVVGPGGEEIYTDQYGRVKVQFPWDRVGANDENSSCWVRTTESWAGKNWGTVFLPRIGQEVVVEFLNGDPDRPLVTGRVYNAAQMPPYALPDNKTQSGIKSRSSTGGDADAYNELRFEDKKDSEDILFHAQKDFHRVVENDDDLSVLHDQTITVKNARTLTVQEADETISIDKGNRSRTVKEGNDTLNVSKGNRAVTVGEGNESLTVTKGNRTVEVGQGNDALTVKQADRTVTVELGNDTLTVKAGNHSVKVNAGTSGIEAMQSITLKCGPSEIKIEPAGVTIKGPTVKVQADAMASVKAPMTEVKGDGMLTLKGGITMIN